MKYKRSFLMVFALFFCSCDKALAQQNVAVKKLSDSTGYVLIDGAAFNYVAQGKGRPCLVLGSSIYYPRTFSKNLRTQFRFYFVDLRWFAKIHPNVKSDEYNLHNITDDIENIRSALQLKNPVLIGHSIHGTIAMEYAKQYPKHIKALIMIGSPNIFGNRQYDDATTEIWRTASPERKQMQDNNWKLMPDKDTISAAQLIIEEYCAMGPKYWYDSTYNAKWLWKDMSIDAPLLHHIYNDIFLDYIMFDSISKAPVKTFVALGKYDFIIPAALWLRQGRIENVTVHVFEKSGHTPQWEESEAFDKEILNWLDGKLRPHKNQN
ncbi:MAG: alpha/beta hydrolase [Cyclobacteriaceae bacterium]|nr:alpha/beta hydrolase [Cyclobacteriaceae bacterium]MDH4296994.1 alpha/beta hydrolase [Cyclobacteriaceae bacterium]MDH5250858.1 alpha/beta hydrolase [Cyclobacteriaceae bacterium]